MMNLVIVATTVLLVGQTVGFQQRSPDPLSGGPPGGRRGSFIIDVSKNPGAGLQVNSGLQGDLYRSRNGNWRVQGNVNHEFGQGRKPSFGGGISLNGRFRRDVDGQEEHESFVNVPISEIPESGQREKRSFAPRVGGGGIGQGQSGDRGSWNVGVNKNKGRGPQIRTEAQGNIYKGSKVSVDAQGFHEAGRGRKPDYGGQIKVSGRWRRDLLNEQEEQEIQEDQGQFIVDNSDEDVTTRERRSPRVDRQPINQFDGIGKIPTSAGVNGRGPSVFPNFNQCRRVVTNGYGNDRGGKNG